jgi:hypothetical protein
MKTTNNAIIKFFLPLIIILFSTATINAQEEKKETSRNKGNTIKSLIESKNYIFKAQSVSPQRGGTRQLTPEYDMRLIGDSLVTYLPYFGRAYTAPINTSEGGIKITSQNFDYNIRTKKKGWEITYIPKDNREVRQLFMSVSSNGYAQLRVISNNRDPISFNGYIEELKGK